MGLIPIGLHGFTAIGDMLIVESGDIARFVPFESILCNDWMLSPLLTELPITLPALFWQFNGNMSLKRGERRSC